MTHDVLIQHIRVRPGDQGPIRPEYNDVIALLGPHAGVSGAENVVLDHVSVSWSEDEIISTWYGAHDITISWSIISEALNRSRHRKETHSAGVLIGDSSDHISLHHNLLAHNDFRNPLVIGGGTHDIVNNVIYDWGVLAGEIIDTGSNSFLNFVGNYFRPGPSTLPKSFEITLSADNSLPQIYLQDNLGPHRPGGTLEEWLVLNLAEGGSGSDVQSYLTSSAFKTYPVNPSSAEQVFERVLAGAGATAPSRDPVDLRVLDQVKSGSGAIIDSPREVRGYPELRSASPPQDSDHDGMPDAWEREMGLDPMQSADGCRDLDGDGYTNLEEWLHFLAGVR
jgi:hypothetical protein